MVLKVVNIGDAGTSVQFGANDVDKLDKILSGIDLSSTETIDIATTWKFRDQKFQLRDPTNTRHYIFKTTSGMAADRTVTLPALSANDTMVFAAQAQTLTNKSMDYNSNTFSNFPVGGGGGDMALASIQTVTGAKTFNDTKLLLRNPANTFSVTLGAGAQTAAQTFTFPVTTSDTILTASATQTISNKTISGGSNTFNSIPKNAIPTTTLYNDVDNALGTHFLDISNISSPSTPGTGVIRMYADTADTHLKIKHPSGSVTDLTAAGGGGGSSTITTPTYVVYIDGAGRVNAVNGVTGIVDYSTASAPATSAQTTSLFNSLFTALDSTGGYVFIKAGTYTINDQVNIGNTAGANPGKWIYWWGENRDHTIVQADASTFNTASHMVKQYVSVDLRNFTIKSNSLAKQCVQNLSRYYTHLDNMHFYPGNDIGVYISGSAIKGAKVENCYFDQTIISQDQLAVTLTGTNVEYVRVRNNYFNKLGGVLGGSCFTSAGYRNAIIENNVIDRDPTGANQIWGISLENFGNNYQDVILRNNILNYGIMYLGGAANAGVIWQDILIQGNLFRGGALRLDNNVGDGGANGCEITHVTVDNNKFTNSTGESLRYAATGYNVIRNNTFRECNVNGADPTLGFSAAIIYRSGAANLEIFGNTFIQTLTGTNQSPNCIRYGTIDKWKIHHNNFIKTNTGNILNTFGSPTNVRIYYNEGYVTINEGVTQFSGNGSTTAFNVTHGLGGVNAQTVTPAQVVISTDQNILARVSTIGSTTFTVTFASAPASGTNNVNVYWRASKVNFP